MPYAIRTPDEKRALLAEWRSSGHSPTRFARERGLSKSSILNWARRDGAVERKVPTRFVDVEMIASETVAAGGFVVHIAGPGHRVEVPLGFDAAELRRVVEALC